MERGQQLHIIGEKEKKGVKGRKLRVRDGDGSCGRRSENRANDGVRKLMVRKWRLRAKVKRRKEKLRMVIVMKWPRRLPLRESMRRERMRDGCSQEVAVMKKMGEEDGGKEWS
ncbi:hypothetical protein CDL15_Pgr012717 [Punica granatum]|uniref:Uncharacterized protein n=1 Tax=Punica granatum TaxID=22663 RepID=A0A218XEU4_PUNGR|nr:hypothetical protein CDL15_Pgr012717 [Punica granatum]